MDVFVTNKKDKKDLCIGVSTDISSWKSSEIVVSTNLQHHYQNAVQKQGNFLSQKKKIIVFQFFDLLQSLIGVVINICIII